MDGDAITTGQLFQCSKPQIGPLAAFNPLVVLIGEFGLFRVFLLRKSRLFAQSTQPDFKKFFGFSGYLFHTPTILVFVKNANP